MELIKEAKEYTGKLKVNDLMKRVLKSFLKNQRPKETPVEGEGPRAPLSKGRVPSNSRYIPRKVKDEVRTRDNHQCSFISKEGKRCCERIGLQFDHINPFTLGGTTSSDNLRLLCRGHNQLHAEQTLGKEFMQRKRSFRVPQPR